MKYRIPELTAFKTSDTFCFDGSSASAGSSHSLWCGLGGGRESGCDVAC